MFRRPTGRWATAVLVLGVLTACSDGPGPTEVTLPLNGSVFADQGGTSFYDLYNTELSSEGASLYTQYTGARLATTDSPARSTVATAIIGPAGGTISAGDHSLVVPRNAVSQATEFTMESIGGNNIVVDLSARSVASGNPVSVFPVPLTLTLSYKGLIKNSDAKRLRNVYLFLDSESLLVPLYYTLDKSNKALSSPIWHFSRYGMAIE